MPDDEIDTHWKSRREVIIRTLLRELWEVVPHRYWLQDGDVQVACSVLGTTPVELSRWFTPETPDA